MEQCQYAMNMGSWDPWDPLFRWICGVTWWNYWDSWDDLVSCEARFFFFRSTSLMRKIEETPHWGFFFGIDYSLRSFLGPPVLWGLLIDFHDYIFNRDQLWSTIFFFLHHRGDVDEVPSRHLIIPSRNQPWQWNMAYDSYESRCFSWFNGYSNIIKPWFNHHHL